MIVVCAVVTALLSKTIEISPTDNLQLVGYFIILKCKGMNEGTSEHDPHVGTYRCQIIQQATPLTSKVSGRPEMK